MTHWVKGSWGILMVLIGCALLSSAWAEDSDDALFEQGVAFYAKGAYEQAFKTFQSLSIKGKAGAQYNLGHMYKEGQGVGRDYEQAAHWFTLSADQGSAEARNELASMYFFGNGVEKNIGMAERLYRLSAEQGLVVAQFNLGLLYEAEAKSQEDIEKAFLAYLKAAEKGNRRAQFYVGTKYATGRGVVIDKGMAVQWFLRAADQGDGSAQDQLGWAYRTGEGVAVDLDKAIFWFRKASESGNSFAQSSMYAVVGDKYKSLAKSDVSNQDAWAFCAEAAAAWSVKPNDAYGFSEWYRYWVRDMRRRSPKFAGLRESPCPELVSQELWVFDRSTNAH